MHNELLGVPSSRQDLVWMNEFFAIRSGFMSAHQMPDQVVSVFDVRRSSISLQRVDPFDHSASRVVLQGTQFGFDALAEYGYRPAAVPLAGAVSFGIGFAQRYSQHGRAGQALFGAGLNLCVSSIVPFPLSVILHLGGSFSVYARGRFIDEHSFDFTAEFFSPRLVEAAGGNPDLALLYYGDYREGMFDSLSATYGWAFIHELIQGIVCERRNSTNQDIPSENDTCFTNANSFSLRRPSVLDMRNKWFPILNPTRNLMPHSFSDNFFRRKLSPWQQVLPPTIDKPPSIAMQMSTLSLLPDRLTHQQELWEKLKQMTTYTTKDCTISGMPKITFNHSNEIVTGITVSFGGGAMMISPFIAVGGLVIGYGIQKILNRIEEGQIKKIARKIKNTSGEVNTHFNKMISLKDSIDQFIEEGDFKHAMDCINQWRSFRQGVMAHKIDKLKQRYQSLKDRGYNKEESQEQLQNLDNLTETLYSQDTYHDIAVAVGESQIPNLTTRTNEYTVALQALLESANQQFQDEDRFSLEKGQCQLNVLRQITLSELDNLIRQYQILSSQKENEAVHDYCQLQTEQIVQTKLLVQQYGQELVPIIHYLMMREYLFVAVMVTSMVKWTLPKHKRWVGNVLDMGHLLLISEIDFQADLLSRELDGNDNQSESGIGEILQSIVMYRDWFKHLFPAQWGNRSFPSQLVPVIGYAQGVSTKAYHLLQGSLQRIHYLKWETKLQMANRVFSLASEKGSPQTQQWMESCGVLSDSLLWASQCRNQYHAICEAESWKSLVSPGSMSFNTASQTIITINRIAHFIQQGHDRALEKNEKTSRVDNFFQRVYRDYPRTFLMIRATAEEWSNDLVVKGYSSYASACYYFPIGQSLLTNAARHLNLTMPSHVSGIHAAVISRVASLSANHWLTRISGVLSKGGKLAYLGYLGWKIYQGYQFYHQYQKAEQHILHENFDDADQILMRMPNKKLSVEVTKAIVSLHKENMNSKNAINLIDSLLDKFKKNQSNDPDRHLCILLSLSIELVRESRLPFDERLDYLKKVEVCIRKLSEKKPDQVNLILNHLSVVQYFLLLAGEQDEKPQEGFDLFSMVLERVDSFTLKHDSSEVQYLAHMIIGETHFARYCRTDHADDDYQSAKGYLETALKIFEESLVNMRSNVEEPSLDQEAIQILYKLAILACKNQKWRSALRLYNRMDNYNMSETMKSDIDNEKIKLRQIIEFQSHRQSLIRLPESMGMFHYPDQNIPELPPLQTEIHGLSIL